MTASFTPVTLAELVDAVRSAPHVVAVGAGTKPRLVQVDARYQRVSLRRLQGVVEYEPDEYTITVLAGTSVAELAQVLADQGQYLPFDPCFAGVGATIGGTIASGLSGPGRFRFGGLRDFILGVRFVDGDGRLLRVGGKVVKNAAGFDLPKLFVGSLGRFGLLGEVTLKVFPRPVASLTVHLAAATPAIAQTIVVEASRGRWQLDALDLPPSGNIVSVRLAGPETALAALANDILSRWPGRSVAATEAARFWDELNNVRWRHDTGSLMKIALSPERMTALNTLVQALPEPRLHLSAGGNVALLSLPASVDATAVSAPLGTAGLSAMLLQGSGPLWLGINRRPAIAQAIKEALDSAHRYPSLDE